MAKQVKQYTFNEFLNALLIGKISIEYAACIKYRARKREDFKQYETITKAINSYNAYNLIKKE